MFPLLILAASASATTPGAPSLHAIEAIDGRIMLGQVADLSGYDLKSRKRLSSIVIATLPKSDRAVAISSRSMKRWSRAAVPELRFGNWPERDYSVKFLSHQNSANKHISRADGCKKSRSSISVGEPLTSSNTRPTACVNSVHLGSVYFDRKHRLLRASASIPSDTFLGRVRIPDRSVLDSGTKLSFVTGSGPVAINRQVMTLQPAMDGERLFVATKDGRVFDTVYRSRESK